MVSAPPLSPSPAGHTGFERVAHRGAPRERLENTLPGFLVALERGADAIELDVHLTKDGVVAVHHDDFTSRYPIAETSWGELASLDLGQGATIPRLDDVLAAIGDRATVYIELKGRGIEGAVIDVARAHGRQYALHSFDHDAMARVANRAPDIARGVLLDRGIPGPVEVMRGAVDRIRPRDVWPHWSLVDAAFMDAARKLGTRVIAWTVNSTETARELQAFGVAGVCTDDVRLLVNL
ncbi:MAG: glycerophosphodiester phosphodiesterase [Gemmatimonadaceae bacterium]